MSRVNVYLPDDLAERARSARLNVSAITRTAIEAELAAGSASRWLERVAALPQGSAGHDDVLAAIAGARDELGADGP